MNCLCCCCRGFFEFVMGHNPYKSVFAHFFSIILLSGMLLCGENSFFQKCIKLSREGYKIKNARSSLGRILAKMKRRGNCFNFLSAHSSFTVGKHSLFPFIITETKVSMVIIRNITVFS